MGMPSEDVLIPRITASLCILALEELGKQMVETYPGAKGFSLLTITEEQMAILYSAMNPNQKA
jgi:hypothetical protein